MPFNAFALVKKRTHLEHIELRRRFRAYVEAHPGCTRKEALAELGCSAALLQRVTALGVAGVKSACRSELVGSKKVPVHRYYPDQGGPVADQSESEQDPGAVPRSAPEHRTDGRDARREGRGVMAIEWKADTVESLRILLDQSDTSCASLRAELAKVEAEKHDANSAIEALVNETRHLESALAAERARVERVRGLIRDYADPVLWTTLEIRRALDGEP